MTLDGHNKASFLGELNVSAECAAAQEVDRSTSEARAKEASPDKLTLEKEWEKCATRLIKQLSILQRVLEVWLVYLIQGDTTTKLAGNYETFTEHGITKCPLEGPSLRLMVGQFISSSSPILWERTQKFG